MIPGWTSDGGARGSGQKSDGSAARAYRLDAKYAEEPASRPYSKLYSAPITRILDGIHSGGVASKLTIVECLRAR